MNDEKTTEAPAEDHEPAFDKTQDAPEVPAAEEVKVVDKRRFARLLGLGVEASAVPAAEFGDQDAEPSPERLPSFVAQLKERVERAELGVTRTVEEVTGTPPTSMAEFIATHFAPTGPAREPSPRR